MGIEEQGRRQSKDKPGEESRALVFCEVSCKEEENPSQQGCHQTHGGIENKNKNFLLVVGIVSLIRNHSAQFCPDQVRGGEQQRKARCVFGIFISGAFFPRKPMGLQLSRIKLKIVFIFVIVEKIEVSVKKQAVSDQKIVGFVSR